MLLMVLFTFKQQILTHSKTEASFILYASFPTNSSIQNFKAQVRVVSSALLKAELLRLKQATKKIKIRI